MGNRQYSNNASSILAANITTGATTIQLSSGDGNALFPSLSGTQFFDLAVISNTGSVEYMKCTARAADVLTVTRAQEGTTAQAFTANLARVELRMTAESASNFLQKDGDTLTGPLNLGAQTVTNGTLGSNVKLESCTEIVNTPIRGGTGLTGNQITVPTDGTSRAQAGGVDIVVSTDLAGYTIPSGVIAMWSGAILGIPSGWHLCDGTSGTPDLRSKFVIGAGSTYAPGANGTLSSTSSAVSAGTPTINGHTLTATEIAGHTHALNYKAGAVLLQASGYPTDYITGGAGSPGNQTATTTSAGGDGSHTHTAAALPTHTHTVPTVPYYALAYIMKL